jgi:hypothetical protein
MNEGTFPFPESQYGAGRLAQPAFILADTARRIDADLSLWRDALGIAAPYATHGATLEEYLGAYAGTVVYCKSLDIYNITYFCHSLSASCAFSAACMSV